MIVLRSLGKFFGLAGTRVGFIFASAELRESACRTRWGRRRFPARRAKSPRLALADGAPGKPPNARACGQPRRTLARLARAGSAKSAPRLISPTLKSEHAAALHAHLARHTILTAPTRIPLLRVGLPGDEAALSSVSPAVNAWSPHENLSLPASPQYWRSACLPPLPIWFSSSTGKEDAS